MRSRFESLGDRVKRMESMEASRTMMPGLPIMMRLDGRSFHTFTKGMQRPFCAEFSECMLRTTEALVRDYQADFGYTQSDEITLGWKSVESLEEFLFSGRVQKLTSVLAAAASVEFNIAVRELLPEYQSKKPLFDARVFNMPTMDMMVEGVMFRYLDCVKNSMAMAVSSYFTPGQLRGKKWKEQHAMLLSKNINWANYPESFKNGTFVRAIYREKTLDASVVAKIPEAFRLQNETATRRVIERESIRFSKLSNTLGFLFQKEEPIYVEKSKPVLDDGVEVEAGSDLESGETDGVSDSSMRSAASS